MPLSRRQTVRQVRRGSLTTGRGREHDQIVARRCQGSHDLGGAIAELVTAIAYGLYIQMTSRTKETANHGGRTQHHNAAGRTDHKAGRLHPPDAGHADEGHAAVSELSQRRAEVLRHGDAVESAAVPAPLRVRTRDRHHRQAIPLDRVRGHSHTDSGGTT